MNTRNSEGVKGSSAAIRLATRLGTSPLIFYSVSLISAASFIVSLTHGPPPPFISTNQLSVLLDHAADS